ncbi:hypothetical protein IAR55_007015 [Kwoniella newhampshirensis]|uniref:Uncharacterized protein n=1 Tax=Kwoniella newhampshirensis TaxID=1651941 RepID=A0AAW0YQ15_9TREE
MSMTAPPLSPRHQQQPPSISKSPPSFPTGGTTTYYSRSPPRQHPGMVGGRTRSSTITSVGATMSGNGFASKSAPTSPTGRIVMTPLSTISPIQLEPVSSSQQQQQQQQRPGLPNLVGGVSADSGMTPTAHTVRLPPAHPIHSQSLPTSLAVPRAITSQPIAGPSSTRPFYPPASASTSSVPRPSDPISIQHRSQPLPHPGFGSRVRARQIIRQTGGGGGGGPPSESGLSDDSVDSDSTVRPGWIRHKQSLSQPDLQVLRSKRVEGWADGVMKGQIHPSQVQIQEGKRSSQKQSTPLTTRRPSLGRTKTPPSRSAAPIPIHNMMSASSPTMTTTEQWLPASPKTSRSHPSLHSLRKSPSPRSPPLSIPHMSPINPSSPAVTSSSSSEGSSPRMYYRPITSSNPLVGAEGLSSEDADDDYESTDSPSSGSLTFSPKRTRSSATGGLRQRFPLDKTRSSSSTTTTSPISPSGLGLSFGPVSDLEDEHELTPTTETVPLPLAHLERMIRQSSLLSLRLLAIVPAVWGIAVLLQALVTARLWVDVWPYGVDLSKEALERLVQGGVMVEGEWRGVSRGDMVLCIAWAICTGHFCFCLTTGLTHRWRSYYPLPSTITRLVSLQCLCWPATYLTLWFLGAERPLLAWVVIGVTTGWSRTVQMWVTSNVVPASSTFETSGAGGAGPNSGGGDLTPNGGNSNGGRRSSAVKVNAGPPITPEGLTPWEQFTYGRKWDWDDIAREVGWKVGGLLLITTAWLFWGIERGRLVRA